jgi:hypothetical protein
MVKKIKFSIILCMALSNLMYASQPKSEEKPLLNNHNNQQQEIPNTVLFKCPNLIQKLKNLVSCPIPSFTANRFWESAKAWRDLKTNPKK